MVGTARVHMWKGWELYFQKLPKSKRGFISCKQHNKLFLSA